jgi:hypothetical protein
VKPGSIYSSKNASHLATDLVIQSLCSQDSSTAGARKVELLIADYAVRELKISAYGYQIWPTQKRIPMAGRLPNL